MSSFTSDLILRALPDGRRFALVQEFDYEVGALGSGRVIRVPAGFVTDFASIPQVFWNILPPWGVYGKPCVLHDYMYQGGFISEPPVNRNLANPARPIWFVQHTDPTREQADNILREAMQALGVGWWTRQIIFRGVRMGGGRIWDKEHHPHEAR